MPTLTLELDGGLARALEESARREQVPVAAWAREHLRRAAIEAQAQASGYPKEWLKLMGCLDDATFEAPARGPVRSTEELE